MIAREIDQAMLEQLVQAAGQAEEALIGWRRIKRKTQHPHALGDDLRLLGPGQTNGHVGLTNAEIELLIAADYFQQDAGVGELEIQKLRRQPARSQTFRDAEPALENCRRLLAHARAESWPVAHVRHLQDSHIFNANMEWSRFVEGFEPMAHEMVFTKENLSCYSTIEFSRMMESAVHNQVFLMGFEAQTCCLSTLVDAFHRGHSLSYVGDASLARRTDLGDEHESFRWVREVISIYAPVLTTDEVLATQGGRAANRILPPTRAVSEHSRGITHGHN